MSSMATATARLNHSSLSLRLLSHQHCNITITKWNRIGKPIWTQNSSTKCLSLPRSVAEQACGGSQRVHQLLQPREAPPLPQHHQEYPGQHLRPPVPCLPGHQQEPAELPSLLSLPPPAPAMPGRPQQPPRLLARGDWGDEQVDGARCVLQRDRPPTSPDWRPCQPPFPPPPKESSSRGEIF